MFCPNCGKQIKDDANFCRYCGISLENWKDAGQAEINSYAQAVAMARAGNEYGYTYLYEQTYKSKYYLALKYMDTKEAAEDVLQDAYIKAFSRLDTLTDPESFPSWFGTIVANTAKDALQKKNPVLFTDMSTGDEDLDEQELQIPDEDLSKQPEVAYTKQETSEMVQEMIGALSEEQKMCILMYYIDGESVRDIASALGCSENTVKSRLNYGRKNLKAEAEELQKKGYNLYGLAPLPLLLLLLHMETGFMESSGALGAGMSAMEGTVLATTGAQAAAGSAATGGAATAGTTAASGSASASGSAGASAGAGSAASTTAHTAGRAAAGQGFLHTAAGQIAIGAAAAVVGVGVITGGVVLYRSNQSESEPVVEEAAPVQEAEPETAVAEPAPEPEPEPAVSQLNYNIDQRSTPVTDSSGNVIANNYYELIQVEDVNDATALINNSLQADYQEYLNRYAWKEGDEELDGPEPGSSSSAVDVSVANNSDGIFSVGYSWSWVWGDSPNGGIYGHTYDMNTGQELGIRQVTTLSDEELLASLKSAMQNFAEEDEMAANYYEFYNSQDDIDSLTLDDIKNGREARFGYIVEDGEITLLVPDEIFARYGVTLPTGIPASLN